MSNYILILTSLLLVLYSRPALSQTSQPWKLFELKQLTQKNKTTDGSYFRFLNEPTLSMGLYELKAGTSDAQNPHQLDEVYYIVKGEALLVAGVDTVEAAPGTIAYVKAGIPHRFVDIAEDLQVLVIFSKTEPSAGDPDYFTFTLDELREQGSSDQHEWHPFLDVSTMKMGLYMLARTVRGDETLAHEVDEINIVVDGKSTFMVDNEKFEVKPGSVFYVEQGHGHHFKELREEYFEVLILFHKNQE